LQSFGNQVDKDRINNPILYVHNAEPQKIPNNESPLTFSLLLNLASVCHAEGPEILWGYIDKYAPGISHSNNKFLEKLVSFAVIYYNDMIKPNKAYRSPNEKEQNALMQLIEGLKTLSEDSLSDEIQKLVFLIGKENEYENLRDWFKSLYEILLGQSDGPRMGSFISLYGIAETVDLIQNAINGELK